MTSQTEYARKAVYMVVHIQLIQQSFGLFPVLLKKKKKLEIQIHTQF